MKILIRLLIIPLCMANMADAMRTRSTARSGVRGISQIEMQQLDKAKKEVEQKLKVLDATDVVTERDIDDLEANIALIKKHDPQTATKYSNRLVRYKAILEEEQQAESGDRSETGNGEADPIIEEAEPIILKESSTQNQTKIIQQIKDITDKLASFSNSMENVNSKFYDAVITKREVINSLEEIIQNLDTRNLPNGIVNEAKNLDGALLGVINQFNANVLNSLRKPVQEQQLKSWDILLGELYKITHQVNILCERVSLQGNVIKTELLEAIKENMGHMIQRRMQSEQPKIIPSAPPVSPEVSPLASPRGQRQQLNLPQDDEDKLDSLITKALGTLQTFNLKISSYKNNLALISTEDLSNALNNLNNAVIPNIFLDDYLKNKLVNLYTLLEITIEAFYKRINTNKNVANKDILKKLFQDMQLIYTQIKAILVKANVGFDDSKIESLLKDILTVINNANPTGGIYPKTS